MLGLCYFLCFFVFFFSSLNALIVMVGSVSVFLAFLLRSHDSWSSVSKRTIYAIWMKWQSE